MHGIHYFILIYHVQLDVIMSNDRIVNHFRSALSIISTSMLFLEKYKHAVIEILADLRKAIITYIVSNRIIEGEAKSYRGISV